VFQTKRLTKALSLLILIALLSLSSPLQAQLGKRPAKEYIAVLESPGRIERLQPDKVISRLGLKDGEVVADIGAGSGVFTGRLARAVAPGGKILAVDIDQELLDYNRVKIQNAKISNVEFILGGFDDPKLSRESCDLIFICDVLHHIEHRQLYLRNLRACIKPAGRLAIIDYKTNWPPGHEQMKYSIEELLDWTRSAGWEKEGEFDLIPDAFFYVFRPIWHHALLTKEAPKEKALKIAKTSGP
jgi:arsenite methyltransferase